jgi:hypothetical protein
MDSKASDKSIRHRKPFFPPADDDADSLPEEMDEQEQEELITRLKTLDSSTIDAYQTLFFFITIVCILPYFVFLPGFYLSLLAISSIAASGYTLHLPIPGYEGGALWANNLLPNSPINKFLPLLNAVLATVIALPSFTTKVSSSHQLLILHLLPICKYQAFEFFLS